MGAREDKTGRLVLLYAGAAIDRHNMQRRGRRSRVGRRGGRLSYSSEPPGGRALWLIPPIQAKFWVDDEAELHLMETARVALPPDECDHGRLAGHILSKLPMCPLLWWYRFGAWICGRPDSIIPLHCHLLMAVSLVWHI